MPDFEFEFNFLTVAQWGPRKNLENTIKWFLDEFKDKDVGLILKTSIRSGCTYDREQMRQTLRNVLAKYPDRQCKVYLLHGRLSDNEMK